METILKCKCYLGASVTRCVSVFFSYSTAPIFNTVYVALDCKLKKKIINFAWKGKT